MTTYVGIDVGGTSVRVLAETPDGRGELVTAPVVSSYDAFLAQVTTLCAGIAR